MSNDNGYNGYSNWDTWNASLWLNNDEGLYRMAMRLARRYIERVDVGDEIRKMCQEYEVKGDGFNYDEVDWAEVADTFLEE